MLKSPSRGFQLANTDGLPFHLDGPATHEQTALGAADLAIGKVADDLALVDDEYAIGEIEDFIQVERDQQHTAVLVPLGHELAVHELDGADIEPAGGLDGEDHPRLPIELAGNDELLLVTAGERAGRGLRPWGAHVEFLHLLRSDLSGRRVVDAAGFAEGS